MKKKLKKSLLFILVGMVSTGLFFCSLYDVENDTSDYTVTFKFSGESGGKTLVFRQVVKEGSKLSKPDDPVKGDGASFHGWFTDSSYDKDTLDENTYNFDLPVSNDFTLYGRWTYTIIFDSKEGDSIPNSIVGEGLKLQSNIPLRTGYYFGGWTTNSNGTEAYDFNLPVSNSFTLYAMWYSNGYTVTFDFQDEKNTPDVEQKVTSGMQVMQPSVPSRSGYEFLEWTNSSGVSYDFSTSVTNDFTLYASWIRLYEVNFFNDGELIAVQFVREGSNASFVKANNGPSRSGYEFLAWIKASGFDYEFTEPVTSDLTLHAKWLGWNLARIARDKEIPANFNNYDEKSIYVLSGKYASGTSVGSYYVTANGNGNKDGSSWINAAPFNNLAGFINGITDASDAKVYLIFIAAGETYTPQSPLSMKDHVVIVGGYDSLERGYSKEKTVFDGDDKIRLFENIDNNLSEKAVLLDVIIQKGRSADEGGGMYNKNSSPSLMYVTFLNNQAEDGGGLAATFTSYSKFKNVYFSNNVATGQGGGAFFSSYGEQHFIDISFRDAVFSGNNAGDDSSQNSSGGGISFMQGGPQELQKMLLENVLFVSNFAYRGAGIFRERGFASLNNVTFWYNKAEHYGGGMYGFKLSSVIIKNSSFIGNKAQKTAGCALYFSDSYPVVVNTTFVGQCKDGQTSFGSIFSQGSELKLINITAYDNEDGGSTPFIFYDSRVHSYMDSAYGDDQNPVSVGLESVSVLNSIIWSPNDIKIKFDLQGTPMNGEEHLVFSYNIFKRNNSGNWDIFNCSLGNDSPRCISDKTYLRLAENEVYYDNNPQLEDSLNNEGDVYTLPIPNNSFAKDKGIYIQWVEHDSLYYSEDKINWYNTIDGDHGALVVPRNKVDLPDNAEPLNYADARGYTRIGRPDLGAYEAGGIPPSP